MSEHLSKYHQSTAQIQSEEEQIKNAMKNPHRFDVLYNKYFLSIYKYILVRVEDKNLCDEIVSKAFAKALFKIKQYQFKGVPFSAWLYRIAYNEMNDTFRKLNSKRVVQVPLEQIRELAHIDDSSELEVKEERIQAVLNCIKILSKIEIEMIELRFFEKRAFKEIGEILNISEDNAKVKTHRTIKKLKELVEKVIPKSHEEY